MYTSDRSGCCLGSEQGTCQSTAALFVMLGTVVTNVRRISAEFSATKSKCLLISALSAVFVKGNQPEIGQVPGVCGDISYVAVIQLGHFTEAESEQDFF